MPGRGPALTRLQRQWLHLPSLLHQLQADTYANEDAESLRQTVRDLLAKLQEAERQHQSDRVAFEVRFEMEGAGAPRDGRLDAGAKDFLDMEFMCFWLDATD